MTAATTPRLGLLSPASSDEFDIADFVNTMAILDSSPGIKQVANYAALPTTLTTAQHGSVYLQMDNGSLWQWNKPGAGAGTWRKLNNIGLIKTVSQASDITTSTTNPAAGPAMINTSFVFPGGRWCMAFFSHTRIYNSGSFGYSGVNLWVNGVSAETSLMSGGSSNKGISHRLFQPIIPGGYGGCTPGATTTVKVTCASTTYGGGTTTAPAIGTLYIWEV